MELLILRHAVAEKRNSRLYKLDSKRPLTPKGAKQMKVNAKNLRKAGISFDRIVTSPYVRASQTADIVADVYGINKKKTYISNNLIPEKPFDRLVSELRHLWRRDKNLLLVGHEPHLSQFISYLLIGQPVIPMILKKGGLCQLTMSDKSAMPGSAYMSGLWAPSQIQHLK